MRRLVLPVLLLVAAGLVAGAFTVRRALTAPRTDAESVVFEVPKGATLKGVARAS